MGNRIKTMKLHSSEYYAFHHTWIDPILTEQEAFLPGEGGAELEQTEDEGQSPQEQPREVSLHE